MKLNECPVSLTLRFIGGKWKPMILNELKSGTRRAGELARNIPEVSPKVLTQQLRELERDGLITRQVFPVVPAHVEYSLSRFGRTLKPIMMLLSKWGQDFAAGKNAAAEERKSTLHSAR